MNVVRVSVLSVVGVPGVSSLQPMVLEQSQCGSSHMYMQARNIKLSDMYHFQSQ